MDFMNLNYVLDPKTNGANPFKIFESLNEIPASQIRTAIKAMDYDRFLESAYWFAVSTTCKARSGMRCQVCNSGKLLHAHHRTYDTHGAEHLHMEDLVALCDNCHGLFHGHRDPVIIHQQSRPKDQPALNPATQIVLTKEALDSCRTNGTFTTATLRALGMTKRTMTHGWAKRLIGTCVTGEQYTQAIAGRFVYKGRFNKAGEQRPPNLIP